MSSSLQNKKLVSLVRRKITYLHLQIYSNVGKFYVMQFVQIKRYICLSLTHFKSSVLDIFWYSASLKLDQRQFISRSVITTFIVCFCCCMQTFSMNRQPSQCTSAYVAQLQIVECTYAGGKLVIKCKFSTQCCAPVIIFLGLVKIVIVK